MTNVLAFIPLLMSMAGQAEGGLESMDEGKKQILLEKGLVSATIMGCLLRGDNGITNNSDADVQMGLNATR